MPKNYLLRTETGFGLNKNTPEYNILGEEYFDRYVDPESKQYPTHSFPITKRNLREFPIGGVDERGKPLTAVGYSDPAIFNTYTFKDFFKELGESKHQLGFMETIGYFEILGAQFSPSPYLKYTKESLQTGRSALTSVPRLFKAHPWDRDNNTVQTFHVTKDGKTLVGYIGSKNDSYSPSVPIQVNGSITAVAGKEGLFKGKYPQYDTCVSTINYSAEIALKMDYREIYQYSFNPEMATQVMTSMMGISNASYMNNMSAFCNYFIGGIPRGGPPPEPQGVYGTSESSGFRPESDNPMYAFIQIPKSIHDLSPAEYSKDNDLQMLKASIIGGGLRKILYDSVHVDFASLSTKYNPAGVERLSNSCTAFIDSHYRYEFDHGNLAGIANPNYLLNTANDENVPGHRVKLDYGWVPGFPQLATAIYAPEGHPWLDAKKNINHEFKLICLITDDLNPVIRPFRQPVTVNSWFNPQEETTTLFTHYEMMVEFRPFFNRKYVYLDITSPAS